ncbi:MAG: DUF2145 domain-containing protein [Burkholderiales bacterium]|nr:DUF2145 domain-containing protein [Burkholderiales bacterium]
MNIFRPGFACVLLVLMSGLAQAGRSCEERVADARVVQQALILAFEAQQKLDASGAEVALIARAGQNLSRYGVRYSHVGFAWRDHPKGTWRITHELNECGTATSEIYDEGLGNFFLDDLWKMEAVILIPGASTQQRLASIFTAHRHLAFHDARYSMVAYPYSTKYQNSNQWALEVIAAAEARDAVIASREQAQQWLKFAGYQPTELKLDALTRLGARVTKANVAFDDHPGELCWSDRIHTVTVDSIFNFMTRRDAGSTRIEIVSGNAGPNRTP